MKSHLETIKEEDTDLDTESICSIEDNDNIVIINGGNKRFNKIVIFMCACVLIATIAVFSIFT